MRTHKYFLTAAIMLLLVMRAGAQEQAFTILSVKGGVQIIGSGASAQARPGTRISSADKIKVPDNGYIALVHVKGKTAEIKKAGEYQASALAAAISKNDNSMTKKFADFVVNEMSVSSKSGKMTMLGAVSRGGTAAIVAAGPESDILFDYSYHFKWHRLNTAKGYLFRLVNVNGQTIHSIQTNDTSLALDLSAYGLIPGLPYYWVVSDVNNQAINTGSRTITAASEQFKKSIQDSLASMAKEGLDKSSAADMFMCGVLYERNGVNSPALEQYKTAYKLSGGADHFAREYARCLMEQGYGEEADRIMKELK